MAGLPAPERAEPPGQTRESLFRILKGGCSRDFSCRAWEAETYQNLRFAMILHKGSRERMPRMPANAHECLVKCAANARECPRECPRMPMADQRKQRCSTEATRPRAGLSPASRSAGSWQMHLPILSHISTPSESDGGGNNLDLATSPLARLQRDVGGQCRPIRCSPRACDARREVDPCEISFKKVNSRMYCTVASAE